MQPEELYDDGLDFDDEEAFEAEDWDEETLGFEDAELDQSRAQRGHSLFGDRAFVRTAERGRQITADADAR